MKVLVTAASRHGSTAELATEIGKTVRQSTTGGPVEVQVRPVEQLDTLDGYDAVILGSAVYMGRWLGAAADFAARESEALRQRPVWLFSSGPVGDPLAPDGDHVVDIASILAATNAREHRVFAGRIDPHLLGFAERAVIRALRVRPGDYRDWAAVRAWASSIAADLSQAELVLRASGPGHFGARVDAIPMPRQGS